MHFVADPAQPLVCILRALFMRISSDKKGGGALKCTVPSS